MQEKIFLLGEAPVLFGVPGGDLVPLSEEKMWAVLAALALEECHLSAEDLIDAVWGDNPPPSARERARRYISRWRRILKPYGVWIEYQRDYRNPAPSTPHPAPKDTCGESRSGMLT